MVIEALKAKGRPEDAPHLVRLEAVLSGRGEVAEIESCLAEALRALIPEQEPAVLSDAQRALAARLTEPGEAMPLYAWKAANAAPPDARIDRICRQLSRLEFAGRLPAATAFVERLEAIAQVGDAPVRNLRLDSLVLDLSAAVSEAAAETALVKETEALMAELAPYDQAGCRQTMTQLEVALAARDMAVLRTQLEAARSVLAAASKAEAAAARRRALLEGLARLGYAVHEGMAGAWVKEGRVVLQKPSLPGYGVEIGGNPEGERLQVRAVAFSAERDTARDHDVETIWCAEFSRLRTDLAERGGKLDIVRALPVGAAPLRVLLATEKEDPLSPGLLHKKGATNP